MTEAMLTFRMAFLPIWRFVTMWSGGGVAVILLWISTIVPIPLPTILVTMLVAVVSAGVLVPVIRMLPVYLTPDGIRCADAFGIYRTARWEDIETVRPFNFAGLKYLRVRTAGLRREMWLPLFLADMPIFCEILSHAATPDNVLVKAVAEHVAGN